MNYKFHPLAKPIETIRLLSFLDSDWSSALQAI